VGYYLRLEGYDIAKLKDGLDHNREELLLRKDKIRYGMLETTLLHRKGERTYSAPIIEVSAARKYALGR
jgi:hypothetical protein